MNILHQPARRLERLEALDKVAKPLAGAVGVADLCHWREKYISSHIRAVRCLPFGYALAVQVGVYACAN